MVMKREPEILFFFVLFLDCWQASNIKSSSNSKNLEEGLAKIIDKILLEELTQVPPDETKITAGKVTTEKAMKESHPQEKILKSSEFTFDSNKQEEKLARLFDEILLQVHSQLPYEAPFYESRRTEADSATTEAGTRESFISEEKQDKDPALFDRDVSDQLTTVDKGEPEKTIRQEMQNREMPCSHLLSFLRRNIIMATISVAGILVTAVLLLLLVTKCTRRKRPLCPPASMTYNIFIMDGKTWWQKSQENVKNYVRKLTQKETDSCI